jgi:hypothetical protein
MSSEENPETRRLGLFLRQDRVTSGSNQPRYHYCLRKLRPHSREAGNLLLWDCKVTPAGCACQEGNTICCISSNDGLDAGLGVRFPHRLPTPVQWMVV